MITYFIVGVAYLGGADVIVSDDPHLTNPHDIRHVELGGGVVAHFLTPHAFLDESDRRT